MFRSARLKLTVWYLLIIMLISGFFSLVIYNRATSELERGFARIEQRLRHMGGFGPGAPPPFFLEGLRIAKARVLMALLSANGVILILSATAGYFLAGRTLKPIEEALNEQKRFVADASHELRTPLTALKTSLEVALRDKNLTQKEAKKVLESSLEDANSLQTLTDNLLSLAQYQKSNSGFTFEQVNLEEVLQRAYKKVYPLAKKKGIDFKAVTENINLEANGENLEKMMVILLDNAYKYTPKGGKVTLTVNSDRKYAHIEVKDTGIGIPEKDIPHIFNRFYRVDQSRSKTKVAGFGLGLSMVKKIVELHKSSIEVSSVVGSGTSFTVKLPIKHA